MCTLAVKVKDKNDNKPIFDRGQYDEPVAQDTPVGTQIMRVSATDVDEGENQKISYDLSATRIPGLLITFFISLLFLSGVNMTNLKGVNFRVRFWILDHSVYVQIDRFGRKCKELN